MEAPFLLDNTIKTEVDMEELYKTRIKKCYKGVDIGNCIILTPIGKLQDFKKSF